MIAWFRRQDASVQMVVELSAFLVLWLGSGFVIPAGDAALEGRSATVPSVPVVKVVPVPHSGTLMLNGATLADDKTVVAAEVAGQVRRVTVANGAKVETGDVLMELEVAERAAQAAAARANLANAKQLLQSAQELAAAGYLSPAGLTQREANYQAALQQAKAAEKQLADTTIRAPRAGTVSSLPLRAGDFVQVGTTVAEVVGGEAALLVGEVAQENLSELQPGELISATLADGRSLSATIRYVATDASPATRTFKVEAVPDAASGPVPTGMSARLFVPRSGAETAALVSHTQLVLADDGGLAVVGVQQVSETWRTTLLPVQLQEDSAEGIWVVGLPPEGAWTVLRGAALLAPGSEVKPVFSSGEGV